MSKLSRIFRIPAIITPKKSGPDDVMGLRGTVVLVLRDAATGKKKWTRKYRNLITDAGDLYYAERGALLTTGTPISPVPTNFTDTNGVPDMIMELYDDTPANSAPGKANDRGDLLGTIAPSSAKAIDATYPMVNDSDGDNTGAGVDVVTYRVSYITSEANLADIDDLILTNPSPGATEPLIMHAEFGAPFTKTSADTLKVFVNHTFNGV